jgi:hypothetical protein
MDEIRGEIWDAVRHLFPENAVALPLDNGDLLISWKTNNDPFQPNKRTSPIYLRFEPSLIEQMRSSSPKQRELIALSQAETVKAGLWGYEPENQLHNARFIVLG